MNTRFSPSRRSVLQWTVGATGAAALAPRSFAPGASGDSDRSLVVLELFGGNDGLNTVVPHEHDVYRSTRRSLRLAERDLLPLRAGWGMHSALARLHRRFHAGDVAIVEGCGYPAMVASHFRSREVWHAASREGRAAGEGWLARLRDLRWPEETGVQHLAHVGPLCPYAVHSRARPALVFEGAQQLDLYADERVRAMHERSLAEGVDSKDGSLRSQQLAALRERVRTARAVFPVVSARVEEYTPRVAYPATPLARSLRAVAALLDSDVGTRLFSVRWGEFDTHGRRQAEVQAGLFRELDGALGAFLDDLAASERGRQTAVVVFSEFGRRVAENDALGTDHGGAGPMFVLGSAVRGGFYGESASLDELDAWGNEVYTTDFRRVYAAASEWLGVPCRDLLGDPWEPLPLFT